MPVKTRFLLLISLSVACLLAAMLLTLQQIRAYEESLGRFPHGSRIAGVPVGSLDSQAAAERLAQVYTRTPVELRYKGSPIHLDPLAAGLNIDLDTIIAGAEESLTPPYWSGFWDFLWNRVPEPVEAGLNCSVDENMLRDYFQEQIISRYTSPPTAALAVIGDTLYIPGQPGETVDIDQAVKGLQAAMCSPTERVVELHSEMTEALPPQFEQLEASLRSLVLGSGYDGLIELYFQDLETGREINFAYYSREEIAPGVAFTAASTIKIPVMVSAYKVIEGEMPAGLRKSMELMIDLSDNGSTDDVMQQVLDQNLAPIQVTHDMQALGLQNTFLAGFFYPGAPLLDRYETPANQRTDISTDPDIYNQTTASDMGRLLAGIQRCADSGSGPLVEVFGSQMTQAKCQDMVELLLKNRKGVLIEAGLPEGSPLAHKYGWTTDFVDGLMHTASDAAIVYTPGGNFVLTVYLYDQVQLPWDPAQRLVAYLTTSAYNFYNLNR